MVRNYIKIQWKKFINLHHMNDYDDLNFYYKKFLNKLSKICLKIYLPLLLLIYLFTLFLCKLFLSKQIQIFNFHLISFLCLSFLSLLLLVLIRLHTKRKKLWIITRFIIISLLILPLILTYRTEQYHILFATISIILIYSLLTFTLLQSFIISSIISILHISLTLNQSTIKWKNFEIFSLIFYHFVINITGLYSYIESIEHIRQHFYAYKTNLFEKNKYNVDCKKLHTIISYCQQANLKTNTISKPGTVIYCSLSLNEQTRIHTCDELASLIDVLFCQIEQLIIKTQPDAYYMFDNETIIIALLNDEDNNEEYNIDLSCRLAIELFRFIQYVNNITQWNLKVIIGIDYNQINIYSSEYIQSFAYDYARYICEDCLIKDRIYISTKIYDILKTNPFYQFSLIQNNSIYLLYNELMYEKLNNKNLSINTSDMIDQLTRIQAEYYVEKHLGTITLTRSLRKRSLFDLTSKYLHWFSLNFKEEYLTKDFHIIHRTNRPKNFIYLFILLILIGSLFQSFILNNINIYYMIFYPLTIVGLILLICFFYYSINMEKSDINQKFYVYLNILICLTLSTLIFVAIQYHSIQNFKYLFITKKVVNGTVMTKFKNLSSSQINSESFDRSYHEYLIISPLYPLYFCVLFRQCSWIIKTIFLIICSILQLYIFEYIWLTTNTYFPSITVLHHYTTFTLIIIHNILLIFSSYIHEWLEKIDFLWLKQIDNERLMIIRQRNQLIKQASSLFPYRVINYYLNTNTNLSLTQHYHIKYDHMGLLLIRFHLENSSNEYELIDLINQIDYLLKTDENYSNIVMHNKVTVKELLFTIDLNNSSKSIQQLIELLFQINDSVKAYEIHLTACLHIGSINEILIHFKKLAKVDLWSEHLSFIQLLLTKIQINHCLITSTVYNLLNDLYLFRTAGSILNTYMNIENNTNIYFLLGRLIGENIFQGRNTLPLTINQLNNENYGKCSTTDESQYSQQQNFKINMLKNEKNPSLTTTTTTSSSLGFGNEQQSLLKSSSSRKYVRISNQNTLLQAALNSTTDNVYRRTPIVTYTDENNMKLINETMINDKKCLMLTQNIINGSSDARCKSTPPISNRPYSSPQKSSTEDNLRQLLSEQMNPTHSISQTNEETTSCFSGWGDDPPSSLLLNNEKQQDSINKQLTFQPINDGYYPSHPCDLTFTVNMTTTDTKSSHSTITSQQPQQPIVSNFRPIPFNLARKLIAETSESEISIQHEPWTQNIVYQSRNLQQTRRSSSYNNLSKFQLKESPETSPICHPDFLQRWLEEQLNQFRSHIKQTPPITKRKSNRLSPIQIDSTTDDDDESDTIQENTFPLLNNKPIKHSYNHIRYKPLKKTTHLIRHQSLKHRNRPLSYENNYLKKLPKRIDSTSMPRSDISDIESSTKPENLSQSALSNIGSEYDNMYGQGAKATATRTKPHSQVVTDGDGDDDDSDDEDITFATKINRCYF